MPQLPLTLYMIPGTGTDRRMFTPQREALPDLVVPEWLPPLTLNETIDSYANRLASLIDTHAPFALGGVSLGGMIAQQLAVRLKPRAVILIASASSYKALPLSRRIMGRITRMLPDGVIRILFTMMAKAVEKTTSGRKHIYAAMLREMPPRLIRWQSGAATQWSLKMKLSMPVFHIHGDKDTVIPLKNVKPTEVVKDGGHLINATHEQQVNTFILASLGKVAAN